MVLVSIPLVGTIDLDETQIGVVALQLGIVLREPLDRSVKVSEKVFQELIRRKYAGRYRNVDDPLRETLGMPVQYPRVKRYSDESDEHGVSTESEK